MIRNRFRVRFLSLLTILTTAMSGLLVGATAASAQVAPDPAGPTSQVLVVPLSPAVHTSQQGLRWWAIAIIAVAAALAAAAVTELFEGMRHRRNDMTFSAA